MTKEIEFVVGMNVRFVTNRGTRGSGKIVRITGGARGVWYQVLDTDGVQRKVRRAGLAPVGA